MYSGSTQYYNLPQYALNDRPSILGDVNDAYATIDTALHTISEEAGDASALAARVTALEAANTALAARVTALEELLVAGINGTANLGIYAATDPEP